MTPTLGKRKRQTPEDHKNGSRDDKNAESLQLEAQERLRRHFEAKFKPLPRVEKPEILKEETVEDDSDEESEWDGISEDDEQNKVQIIEHTDNQSRITTMSKGDLKAYMVRLFTTLVTQDRKSVV